MKKTVFSIISCILLGGFTNAQNVNIPDNNLRSALVGDNAINTDNDTEISQSEASAFSGTLYLGSLNISNATGLEAFTNATGLQIQGNNLSSLDLSFNINLTEISCNANTDLSTLTLGNNTNLSRLNASSTQVTNIVTTGLTSLENLDISYNNSISSIDLTQNSNLKQFTATNCPLIGGTGSVKEIDFSANSNIEKIKIESCGLTRINVSQNSSLVLLHCSNNNLTYLNVQNGNNGNMGSAFYQALNASNNPNLTCIQIDNGFTPTSPNWNKDASASWNVSCINCTSFVNIPDANFKNALLAQGSSITGAGISTIDTDGDGEICVTEAQAYTGLINVDNQNISDLTGIEAFTNLTKLDCSGNPFTNFDISQNTGLTHLWCNSCSLTNLDVTQNSALNILHCSRNNFTSIDLSNNPALNTLHCFNGSLTSLDVSQNIALTEISCHNNSIVSLDVSQNSSLINLYCSENQLTSLNAANGNNGTMNYMLAINNSNLSCIKHDTGFDPSSNNHWQKDATASWRDDCPSTGIFSINENDISFTIVPNPTSGIVRIDTEVAINSIEVFSMAGQKIYSSTEKIIDLSDFKSGVYFVKVSSEKGTATKKIIKK